MAESTIQRVNCGVAEGSNSGMGIAITYRRSGDTCSVYGTGTLTGALTANNTVIYTLPEGYRPPGNVVATDYQNTNGSIRILSNGKIQSRVARASGESMLFYVTFLMV